MTESLLDQWGENGSLALGALLIGIAFGFLAQRSRSLTGALSPLRMAISEGWTIDGGTSRDLIARTGIGHGGALAFGALWLGAAIVWAHRQRVAVWGWAGAIGVGLSVAAAWWFTYAVSRVAFDPHPIQALSFTGPSAEVLNRVLAGGCAVGAALSGAAVLTATSWVTLIAMWASAALTDRLVDQQVQGPLDQSVPGTVQHTPTQGATAGACG